MRAPFRLRVRSAEGVTLIEIAVVLIATAALIGALAPSVAATVRHAEIAAATTTMTAIKDAIIGPNQALDNMNFTRFTINGLSGGTQVRRLVSDGDVPRDRAVTGNLNWQAVVDNATGLTDFLERHLITNQPRGNPANAYSTTEIVADTYWQGAYLTAPIDSDPWGNRYVVNVEFLGASTNDVVVYSSGPDEQIDSAYQANPLAATDDDLIVLVES
jgi:hypothetical protein